MLTPLAATTDSDEATAAEIKLQLELDMLLHSLAAIF
jgi:hypothetical protein